MPVPGYLTIKPTSPQENDALASRDPAPWGQAAGVLFSGGTTGNLTDLATRGLQRGAQVLGENTGLLPAPKMLSAEEATRRFGIEGGGLHFDKPISESDAANRQAQKRDELGRADVLGRSPIGPLTSFGISLGGGAVGDPAGLALSLIPVVGEGALATRLGLGVEGAVAASRGAQFTRGAVLGAFGGAQGGAIAEGLTYGLAHGVEGRDYDPAQAALGIAMGAVLGSGFHGVGAAMGWHPPQVRTTAAGDPIDQLAELIRSRGERSQQHQVSPKGAFGEMQLMPATAERASQRLGIPYDAERAKTDVGYNRQLGREEVRHLGEVFGGDPVLVSAAYNAGEGRVRQWIERFGDPRKGEISSADFAAKIPFAETRNYVARVTAGGAEPLHGMSVASADGAAAIGAPPELPGFDPLPVTVRALDEEARSGAFLKAVDDLAQDRPVDVGALMDLEHAAGGRPRPELDDLASTRPPLAARLGEADTAVTVRGSEIPVRYGVAELRDLVTSHDDGLVRNPDFPEALQPRDRERAGSQARLMRLQREFNPRLLMESPDAASGAPIVSPDGIVESGNGRTITLRQSAEQEGELFARYRAELERRGYDVKGMSQPVLVRIRSEPLQGHERVRLSREMNADVTERLSDTEQAFEDAAALSPADMGLHQGGEPGAVHNRAFARRFADVAAAGQENAVVDPNTLGLTQAGERRIRAALLARAYQDRELVYAVAETADQRMKGLAQALGAAAPEWADMRAAAARGELAAGVDPTESLTSALALVRHARENRLDLAALVEDRRGQAELFGGDALSPLTESFLRLFYRDAGFKSPTSAEVVGEALSDYARRARQTQPGPTLFGAADEISASEILAAVARKWVDDPDGALARRAALEPRPAARPDGASLPGLGGPEGSGPRPGLRPDAGAGGEGESGGAGAGGGADRAGQAAGLTRAQAAVKAAFADPELRELAAGNDRLLAELGDAARDLAPSRPPETVAEAFRAAAFCLADGAV